MHNQPPLFNTVAVNGTINTTPTTTYHHHECPNSTNAFSALDGDATKINGNNTNSGTSTSTTAGAVSANVQQALLFAYANTLPSDQHHNFFASIQAATATQQTGTTPHH